LLVHCYDRKVGKMNRTTLCLLLFLIAACTGCQPVGQNPTVIPILTQPLAQREHDTSAPFASYRTFFVLPYRETTSDVPHKMTPISHGQLSFALRNAFECLGYRCARSEAEADMLCGLYYSNAYHSEYVPPSTSIVPFYVPGTTQTTNINVYGSRGGSAWGTATTTTPGQFVPMPVTRPGYYAGAYYPYIAIVVFDRNSARQIWTGNCIVATPEQDIRRSGQVLISYLFVSETQAYFPVCSSTRDDTGNGAYGLVTVIATLDGNTYYPFVAGWAVGSPASSAGLRIYDKVAAIDGYSTQGLPLERIIQMMDKNLGDTVTLTVERNGTPSDITMLAWSEDLAKAQWQKIRITNSKGAIVEKHADSGWWKDFKYLWGIF